jgi:hypothetical protein
LTGDDGGDDGGESECSGYSEEDCMWFDYCMWTDAGCVDYDNSECQNYDCMDQCYDGYEGWLGDGYCDDGAWGMVFICDEYGNDCGDCGTNEDPLNVCGGDIFECTCDEGLNNLSVVGSGYDTDGDGTEDDCFVASDGSVSNYFYLSWEGCAVTDICYGVDVVFENELLGIGNFVEGGVVFYGFGPGETYQSLM